MISRSSCICVWTFRHFAARRCNLSFCWHQLVIHIFLQALTWPVYIQLDCTCCLWKGNNLKCQLWLWGYRSIGALHVSQLCCIMDSSGYCQRRNWCLSILWLILWVWFVWLEKKNPISSRYWYISINTGTDLVFTLDASNFPSATQEIFQQSVWLSTVSMGKLSINEMNCKIHILLLLKFHSTLWQVPLYRNVSVIENVTAKLLLIFLFMALWPPSVIIPEDGLIWTDES